MIARRLSCVASVLCALLGLVVVPAAAAAPAAKTAVGTIDCDQAVALGSTTPCALGAGHTARYGFTVPTADTVRFRAAVPDGNPGRTLTLSASDGTVICTKESFPQFDCAVPSGGSFRLDVTLDEAATVYTTIESVLTAACGAPLDVSVGNSGSTVHIADPGGSWCAGLDVPAGEGLEMVLDVNTDQGLKVSVYDDTGTSLCELDDVTAFDRPGCLLTGGGDGYRLFASPYDDAAQDMVLIVTQVSHPTGCVTRAPDPFGVAASRRAPLTSHQQHCYAITGTAGQGIGAHLFALGGPSNALSWILRTAGGAQLCTGGPADQTHRLSDCTLPTDGHYYLFVSTLSRATVRYALSLVKLSSDAGCAPASSTKWTTSGDTGSLAGLGEVDCATFTGNDADIVRTSVYGDTLTTSALITTQAGAPVCDVNPRAECRLPATGTYRVVVSTSAQTTVNYRDWVIDESSTAGCRATTLDTFGVAPDRRARFSDNVAVCYTFSAPVPQASYYFRTTPVTHHISTVGQVRSTDGDYTCTDPGCAVPAAGQYLYVVTRSSFIDSPTDIGSAAEGLWRLDQPTGCTTLGTGFNSAAAAGTLPDVAEVDCHQFAGTAQDRIVTRTTPSEYQVSSRVFDRDGATVCFVVSSTCTLTGTGPYRMLTAGTQPADYKVRVASLTEAKGCTDLAVTSFGRAPTRAFDLDDPVDLRCYRITMPDFGQVGVRTVKVSDTTAQPSVALYGPGASGFCAVRGELGACPVSDTGDYLLVASADAAVRATLGWYDLASTAGCTPGPTLAFGAVPTPQVIRGRGAIACMTLPLVGNDKVRFAFGSSPAGAHLHALLLSKTGVTTCEFGSSDQYPANCVIPRLELGPVRMVVYASEDGSAFTGALRMHAWRLNNPAGCADIGSLHNGFGPLAGRLTDKNDVACYLGTGRPGTLAVTTSNDDVTEDVPLVQFYRANGALTCGVIAAGSCAVQSAAYTLLVQRNPQDVDYSGRYRVQGTCASGKCGP